MGERSNIVVENYNGNRVYLYGHWMGEESIQIVGDVLDRGLRWDDEGYLTRMLFNRMTQTDPEGELGYGITTYLADSNYPSIVLNCATQMIHLEDGQSKITSDKISFHDYVMVAPRGDFENLLRGFHSIAGMSKRPLDITVLN